MLACPGAEPAARAPNVVLYVVDTLRADHLGVYGYHEDTSPVIDRFAEGGVVFERAYAPSSWTKPSMVTLMSGLDAVGHGVEDRLDVIPARVGLLVEHLKAGGYATFAAVTNPNVLPHWGFDRGFDVYEDLGAAGHTARADVVSDWAVARMDELSAREPFLLYLHVIDPHAPYDPPAPFDTRFSAPLGVGGYDGEIAFVDAEFGRLLEALRERGIEEDTMVVLVADHGEELLDHGNFGHGSTVFEEVVRVPLVIRLPGGAFAGARIRARATLADVFSTVLAVAGRPVPDGVDGRDLRQTLEGEPAWASRPILLSVRTTGPESSLVRGVVEGPYKYVRSSRPVASEALYDVEDDPEEIEDMAEMAPEARSHLASTLDAVLGAKATGIHLRVWHDAGDEPVACEARLRTTGRFIHVSPVRLEDDDRFQVSDDGRRLRLACRLENREQTLRAGSRRIPDEDGVAFRVTPPDAEVIVEQVRLVDGTALPLRVGSPGAAQAVPFAFRATEPAWSVPDADSLIGPKSGAYVGVVRSPEEGGAVPAELLERLRALGYATEITSDEVD